MTIDPGQLRSRLRDIVRPAGRNEVNPPVPASSDVPSQRGVEQPLLPGVRQGGRLEQILGGEWHVTGQAKSFVVRRRFDPLTVHGNGRVGKIAERLAASQSSASLLTSGAVPRVPFVFFDLETTGLSGGAGTHAFLVGCGWFENDGAFVVEQHLMTDFATERNMLTVVAEGLAGAGALVTFNGKSFDAPVIETRYLFHRLSSPCGQIAHVDVLHPARRFWGGDPVLGCSLVALERQLLGARRIGDVPGFEIPARYFHFIRSGDAQPLADVLEHNRLDLLSLAGVTARLLTLVHDGPGATSDVREALALGRVYERASDERAPCAYERALELATQAAHGVSLRRSSSDWAGTRQGIQAEALRSLAVMLRRQRRFNEAAERWRLLLEVPGCPSQMRREATEALAIHHEHRDRDLAAAKMFALKSLETGAGPAWGDAVRHRLARIERKMVSERPLFPSSPLLPSSGSPTSEHQTSS
jgi:uncharacterized protein YprB with RNaseH-like and TPR domain